MQNHGLRMDSENSSTTKNNLTTYSADLPKLAKTFGILLKKSLYWASVVRENSFSLDVSKDLLLRRFNGQSCQIPTYLKPRFEMYKGSPINHIPYAHHYKLRLVYFLPHFSLRFIL